MTFRPTDPTRSAATNESDFVSRSFESLETRHASPRLAEFYLDSAAPTVLVVDDSVEIRNALIWILGTCGCRAFAAQDGLRAKQILPELHPALMVSDLRMPVCDGWDLLAFCHEHYPTLPVLIMSGDSLGSRPKIEALASGYVAKPIDLPTFRGEVSRLISHVGLRSH